MNITLALMPLWGKVGMGAGSAGILPASGRERRWPPPPPSPRGLVYAHIFFIAFHATLTTLCGCFSLSRWRERVGVRVVKAGAAPNHPLTPTLSPKGARELKPAPNKRCVLSKDVYIHKPRGGGSKRGHLRLVSNQENTPEALMYQALSAINFTGLASGLQRLPSP